jgi:hypothetical protein
MRWDTREDRSRVQSRGRGAGHGRTCQGQFLKRSAGRLLAPMCS